MIDTASTDTLEKFGTEFQLKCLVGLLSDRSFLEQVYDIVRPLYFDDPSYQWIVEILLDYYQNYRAIPTKEVLGSEWRKLSTSDEGLKLATKQLIMQLWTLKKEGLDDLPYIQDEFLTFCKNQELKNAILKSADLLSVGKYSDIKVMVDKAMRAGEKRDIGTVWNTSLADRTNVLSRNTIATPWPVINELLDGGLGAGELGCVIAPTGIGKSWFLAKLGEAALRQGKRVVHYTFELSKDYVGLRYDSILAGIEPRQIKNNLGKVQSIIDDIPGELIVQYYPTRTVTAVGLHAHLQQLIRHDMAPDLMIIDYADLMRSLERSNAKHEELGYIYEEIRGLCGEMRIPAWTASQSQRSSTNDEIVEVNKIAGSFAKVMVCDAVMTVSRQVSDKMSNSGRVHIPKNRFGSDGVTYPALIDLSCGNIQIYDENSPEGIKLKAQIASGRNNLQSLLQQKLIEINDRENAGGTPTNTEEHVDK